MNTFLFFSSASVQPQQADLTLLDRIKSAMIYEASLIASNLKVFLGTACFAVLGVVDIATESGSGWENKTVQGLLVAALIFLFRQLIVERKENKEAERKLWERLLREKKGMDDDDENSGRPTRHTR